MRKWKAWMMLAALLCTGCSARNADYYEQAQLYLGGGDYETAAYLFEQLGEYRDAGEYLLYARALEACAAQGAAFPAMDAESLSAAYPGLSQSSAQVLHNVDERCRALSEKE